MKIDITEDVIGLIKKLFFDFVYDCTDGAEYLNKPKKELTFKNFLEWLEEQQ